MIHLDTHVVVWLAAGLTDKVPTAVLDRIEADTPGCSPMVRLELTYLHEIGRLRHPAGRVLHELARSLGLTEDTTAFTDVIDVAATMTWTRDPFDRIIAAQAVAAGTLLATADSTIRAELPDHTTWPDAPPT